MAVVVEQIRLDVLRRHPRAGLAEIGSALVENAFRAVGGVTLNAVQFAKQNLPLLGRGRLGFVFQPNIARHNRRNGFNCRRLSGPDSNTSGPCESPPRPHAANLLPHSRLLVFEKSEDDTREPAPRR